MWLYLVAAGGAGTGMRVSAAQPTQSGVPTARLLWFEASSALYAEGQIPTTPHSSLLHSPSAPCPGLDGVISKGMTPPNPTPGGLLCCKGGSGQLPIEVSLHSTKSQWHQGHQPPCKGPCLKVGSGSRGCKHPTLAPHFVWGREGWETGGTVTACQKNAQPARPPRPLCPGATAACWNLEALHRNKINT